MDAQAQRAMSAFQVGYHRFSFASASPRNSPSVVSAVSHPSQRAQLPASMRRLPRQPCSPASGCRIQPNGSSTRRQSGPAPRSRLDTPRSNGPRASDGSHCFSQTMRGIPGLPSKRRGVHGQTTSSSWCQRGHAGPIASRVAKTRASSNLHVHQAFACNRRMGYSMRRNTGHGSA